jgi:ADP-heptose:LPS heptosyltransferase
MLVKKVIIDILLGMLALIHVTVAIVSNYVSRGVTKQKVGKHRILVIRIDHKLGDMIISSGFFRELRSHYPDSLINLVIHKSAAQLYEYCPYVDKISIFEWGRSLPYSLINRVSRTKYFVKSNFLDKSFDIVFVPRWDIDHHAKFIAFFSRGLRSIAYSRKVATEKRIVEFGFDSLITENIVDPIPRHEAERSIYLISRANKNNISEENIKPELWLTSEDRKYAEKEKACWQNVVSIAVGPGAFSGKRRWPKERFIEVAKYYNSKKYSIILLGGHDDYDLCNYIRENVGSYCINYAGKSTIRQSAALIEKCALFIGNDSGLLHLAAATSVPCMEISCHPKRGSIMHANSPRRFGILNSNAVICQPENGLYPCKDYCNGKEAHCILQVSVDIVIEKSNILLVT